MAVPQRRPLSQTDGLPLRGSVTVDNVERYLKLYGVTDPAWRAYRIAARQIREAGQGRLRGRMLEIGCGAKTKGLLLGDLVAEHVGLDHEDTPHDKSRIDLFGTAYDIPADSDSFDCVLSTAVLEHLEEPAAALKEAFRVLKPGGYGLYTAPFFWHLHEEPRDFFRYTRYGLDYLFRDAGFTVEKIEPMSGFVTTFLTLLNYNINKLGRGPLAPIAKLAIAMNNLIAAMADRGPFRDERFTWMYLAVVRKPDVA